MVFTAEGKLRAAEKVTGLATLGDRWRQVLQEQMALGVEMKEPFKEPDEEPEPCASWGGTVDC